MTMDPYHGEKNPYIGYVVGGGLKDSLHVRLTVRPQDVQDLWTGDRSAAWLHRPALCR